MKPMSSNHRIHALAIQYFFALIIGKMTFRSLAQNATIVAKELIYALRSSVLAVPFAHIGEAQILALTKLAFF